MALSNALNSSAGLAIGLGLSRLPTSLGYRVANRIAAIIAAQKNSDFVRAVRSNQWGVHQRKISGAAIDALTRATFRSTAHSLYEFWHFFQNPAAIKKMVEFEPSFIARFDEARQAKQGLILVLPHMSNFDLIGRAAALNGFPLHILSYPKPPGSYKIQNSIREMEGLRITPLSMESLRQASDTLRNGGAVVTGVDRPLAGDDRKYHVKFFGLETSLPVFHIRLAVKHKLPVVVVAGRRTHDGRYTVSASDPIVMQPAKDLVQETVQNAEAVLKVLEGCIWAAPDQWAMFYPVWPQLLDSTPK